MKGTFLQLFIVIGILYSNLLGWITEIILFCILCAAVPIVFGICFMFQPETPLYLIRVGRKDKALAAYKKLRGSDYDPSKEIEAMVIQQAKEEELKGQFMVTLKSKQGIRSSTICFMLMFYQQLCGVNAVMFYSGSIFIDAGSTLQPELCVVIIGAVQVIATFCASLFIDKLGRKVLLMLSAFLMSISTFFLGAFFLLKEKDLASEDTLKSIGLIPLISLVVFISAFSIGMGPIPWLASAEIFPTAIMARMSSYAVMLNWFLAFLVTVGYVPVSKAVGKFTTFIVFSIVSATAVPFVLILMPEPKGKTFQEIQDELGK